MYSLNAVGRGGGGDEKTLKLRPYSKYPPIRATIFLEIFRDLKQVKPRFTTTSRAKTSIKKEKIQANLKQENQETIFY